MNRYDLALMKEIPYSTQKRTIWELQTKTIVGFNAISQITRKPPHQSSALITRRYSESELMLRAASR